MSTHQILIVEDEKEIRRFVRLALEGEGWKVFEAENYQRELIESGTRQPDLLILDLGLPDGDGLDLIRDLRKWSSIPIIVLSAREDESQKVAALDAGADDYLTKPLASANYSHESVSPYVVLAKRHKKTHNFNLVILRSILLIGLSLSKMKNYTLLPLNSACSAS